LRRVPEGHIRQVRQLFLDTAKHEADSNEGDSALTESQQETDDFFSFDNDTTVPQIQSLDMECIKFLEDESTAINVLHQYPTIKKMFLKYNTAIPSSAPDERLFVYAGIVLNKKRSSMTDVTFEQQLLLKANRHLLDI